MHAYSCYFDNPYRKYTCFTTNHFDITTQNIISWYRVLPSLDMTLFKPKLRCFHTSIWNIYIEQWQMHNENQHKVLLFTWIIFRMESSLLFMWTQNELYNTLVAQIQAKVNYVTFSMYSLPFRKRLGTEIRKSLQVSNWVYLFLLHVLPSAVRHLVVLR